MAYTVEWNPLLESADVKRTLAKLHVTFMTLSFMSLKQVLKITITNVDTAEVYASNGNVYSYKSTNKYSDRLEQVDIKSM
jgi:hypothetical protein